MRVGRARRARRTSSIRAFTRWRRPPRRGGPTGTCLNFPFKGRRKCGWRDQSGFTLIEVLIALTLLVILTGALYGTYFSLTKAREEGGRRVEQRRELSSTLGRLHQEIASAFYTRTNKNLHFVVLDRDSFGKPTSVLEMTTLAAPRIDTAPASDVALVRYAVKEEKEKEGVFTLTREAKDLYLDVKTLPYPLMENTEGFLVECYNGSQWVKSWDTALNNSLPKQVRVTVTVKGGEVFSTIASPNVTP